MNEWKNLRISYKSFSLGNLEWKFIFYFIDNYRRVWGKGVAGQTIQNLFFSSLPFLSVKCVHSTHRWSDMIANVLDSLLSLFFFILLLACPAVWFSKPITSEDAKREFPKLTTTRALKNLLNIHPRLIVTRLVLSLHALSIRVLRPLAKANRPSRHRPLWNLNNTTGLRPWSIILLLPTLMIVIRTSLQVQAKESFRYQTSVLIQLRFVCFVDIYLPNPYWCPFSTRSSVDSILRSDGS